VARQPKTAFCKHCGRTVTVHTEPIQHALHLFFAVVTLGLWVPIWLIMWLSPSAKSCSECGKDITEEPGRKPERPQSRAA